MNTKLVDLFRWYAIPPSALHEVVQAAARQAGWTPPWDHEEQRSKKRNAGKRSGQTRGGLASMRRSLIKVARARLTPEQRRQPYKNDSIEALCEEYRKLLDEGSGDDLDLRRSAWDDLLPFMLAALSESDRRMLKDVGRETLIKDLKLLRKESGVGR